MTFDKNLGLTDGENRILETIREGASTPTEIAKSLRISISAVSQQLGKLTKKGILSRKRMGRSILYEISETASSKLSGEAMSVETESDWELIRESYEALSKIWSHILKVDLSPDELKKLREARNLLEEMLHERRPSR